MNAAIYDVPIHLDNLKGFTPVVRELADGMRASTAAECASCAIIEYLDSSDERISGDRVNPGVATLGHLLHQAWAFQAFSEYEVEAPIVWKHGVSHDDVLVLDGPHAGIYECKTHSDPKPKAPSAANRRQSEFRLRLRELAGADVPGPMRLVMIGKAGHEGGWVRGPWSVALTDERRTEIDATLEGIDEFIDAGAYDLHGNALRSLSNGCTRCFPKPRQIAAGGLGGLLQAYFDVKRDHDAIDAERKQFVEARKPLAQRLDELRAEIDERVPDGVVIEAMGGTATRTRAGSLVIKGADAA